MSATRPLRLLFVHEVNYRRKVVYEIHDYPELLARRGHEVVFIDFPEGEQPRGLGRLLDLRTTVSRGVARADHGATIEVRTPGRVFAPPLDRFAASLTHMPAVWRALSREQFDAVVLYAVPTNGWQTVMLARHFGVPVLFRAIDVSHLLRKTRLGPLIHTAERYVYRHCDAVSTHNEALRQYAVSEGAAPEKTSIEVPGLDLQRFSPGPRNPDLCSRYGIEPHHRVILFMGTLYRFAGLDWLLREMASLLQTRTDTRLVLIGGGEEEQNLHRLAGDLGIGGSVIFTGFINYPELADHLRLADVAVNTFRKTIVTDCALPGKVLQYLGCGIPTVCTPLEGLRSVLPEGEGILYAPLDHTFVEAVASLLGDDARRDAAARAARALTERLCRWDDCVERFEAAVRRMIECKASRSTVR